MRTRKQLANESPTTPTRPMRYRALTAVVALAALALALPATAAVVDDPGPDSGVHDRAASEAIDIAIIAKDRGWTLDATRRHMVDQDRFGALQMQIEARFPTQFAGAEFAVAPGATSYLRFKGAVPAEARSLAVASRLNVGLTGGRTYSATELANRAVAVVKFFADAQYRLVNAAVLASGQIEAAVTGEQKPGINLPPSLRDGVRVTFVAHDVVEEFHNYGGMEVEGATSECTSGFTVESLLTGEMGLSTAAHCSGIDTYNPPNGGPSYAIDLVRAQHHGLLGDVQWHPTPTHLDEAEYYADPTDRREVNFVETLVSTGNTYCVYSRRQGTRTCDTVWSTYMVTFVEGDIVSDLVAMRDRNAVAGDSGGPWSYGTEAAGTIAGSIWLPFAYHDTWSKAWLFDSAINVEVLTQ